MAIVTAEQLTNDTVADDIREGVNRALLEDDMQTALSVIRNLEEFFEENADFRKTAPRYFALYQDVLRKAKWIALQTLSNEEAARLFHDHLPEVLLNPDYDLMRKLDALLIRQVMLDERTELRGVLRKAIVTSDAELTESAIRRGDGLVPGTLKNWIEDFHSFLQTPASGESDSIKRTEYLVKSATFPRLPEGEKAAVRRLVGLYEYLKLPSDSFEGHEEPIPVDEGDRVGTIFHGRFEPIDQKLVADFRKMIAELDALERQGAVTPEEFRTAKQEVAGALKKNQALLARVNKEEQKFLKEATGNSRVLLDAIFKEKGAAAGALMALARMGALKELFADARAEDFVTRVVLPKLSVHGAETEALKADFAKQKLSPVYQKELLRALLSGSTGENANDAAMLFQHIVNLAGSKGMKELLPLAYYDMQAREYRFVESRWNGSALVNA